MQRKSLLFYPVWWMLIKVGVRNPVVRGALLIDGLISYDCNQIILRCKVGFLTVKASYYR